MSSFDSVTLWLQMIKRGDRSSAEQIWQAYVGRVVRLAQRQLGGAGGAMADEEDVAISAFRSFFERAERDEFERLNNRNDLWQLLSVLTKRKACDLMSHEARQKRGGGLKRIADPNGLENQEDAAAVAPDAAAIAAEELVSLLGLLNSEELQKIALLKLEGFTNAEIATNLDHVERTVERKFWVIRKRWETALNPA